MQSFLLTKIRLSTYFYGFFILFLILSFTLPSYMFSSGALTLFSVNSFLYGFFISPILSAQKARIDALHQTIRSEANALFSLMLDLKKLPVEIRDELRQLLLLYLRAKLRQKSINSGEKQYEDIITYCIDYKGKYPEKVEAVLTDVVANQRNRTDFNMQAGNKVFTNEWHIMVILFGITLGFILMLNVGTTPILLIVRALLCTGLTMLIVNLIKLSTLTHKKAKQMWQPLHKLVDTNFYRID